MTVLEMEAHGKLCKLEERPGKIGKCWRAGRFYEQPLLDHIYRQGFEGVAVDAGANFGNHTIWLAVVCGLRVAAFEPLQQDILTRNVALNNLQRQVQVEPVALGASNGVAETVGKGRLETGRGGLAVRTLDSFGLTDVSVMKVDIEGMEADCLQGGERTIRRDLPVIYAEAWDGEYEGDIAKVLEPWGYRLVRTHNAKESVSPVGEWRCV